LNRADRNYLERKRMSVVLEHAAEFVRTRLAPARPSNDGKQTPWRGHPVFVAQHATATCCRGCLEKWHGIPKGREMTQREKDYAVEVIAAWLSGEKVRRVLTQSPQTDTTNLFG
jgi:exodeoxyribonuclease V alpha subunit